MIKGCFTAQAKKIAREMEIGRQTLTRIMGCRKSTAPGNM